MSARTKRPLGRRVAQNAALALAAAVVAGALSPTPAPAEDALGLVIVGHGAPMPQWNAPVLALENEVRELLARTGHNPFAAVRVALMEFAEPSINTVITELQGEGIDRVYVLPLFIAPSGHSLYDVPTILGLYSDTAMVAGLKEEGATIVDTRMGLTVGPTLHTGTVLHKIMLDRVNELSTAPDTESVVLLAHGDPDFEPIWRSLCSEVGSYITAETGIDYCDYAFVEIGQSFATEGLSAITKAADRGGPVLVVGMYLAMGVDGMARSSVTRTGMMTLAAEELLAGKDVRFAERGLLPDPRVSEWIADRALEWVEN